MVIMSFNSNIQIFFISAFQHVINMKIIKEIFYIFCTKSLKSVVYFMLIVPLNLGEHISYGQGLHKDKKLLHETEQL